MFTIIKTAAFHLVTEVRVYEETIEHIRDGHPEVPIDLPSLMAGLEGTISNPSHIETGNRENTLIYVDEHSTNASGDPFRVPVKVIEGTSGLLKTAYFATPTNPGLVVWRRNG